MKRRRKRGNRRTRFLPLLIALTVCGALLFHRYRVRQARDPQPPVADDGTLVLVTGYCNCGKCCGWRRNWFGFGEPVYTYGSKKGKPKRVGITASGTRAHRGTIAADTKRYPFGTRLEVPGYGTGTVEDIGGAIKDRHIDIWFPTHAEARKWGARWLKVRKVGP